MHGHEKEEEEEDDDDDNDDDDDVGDWDDYGNLVFLTFCFLV